MAKKKGNRIQVILECTEHKLSGLGGTSRYITKKNEVKKEIPNTDINSDKRPVDTDTKK